MKKSFFKIFSLIVVVSVVLSCISLNVFAADSIISFSKNEAKIGDKVTVTVRLRADENMSNAKATVNYDSEIFEYASGDAEGGAGVVKIDKSVNNKNSATYTLEFTALKSGKCGYFVGDCSYTSSSGKQKAFEGCAAYLNVKNSGKSDNADLKSIELSEGKLSPEFSADTVKYEVKVKNSVKELSITATTSDKKAEVTSVSGNDELKLGDNKRVITVTAQSGKTKKYTLNIIRAKDDSETTENENGEFTVLSDLSEVDLFEGFTTIKDEFDGKEMEVATEQSGIYKIYYLKYNDDKYAEPYTLNSETNTFEKLPFITQGHNAYIISAIPMDKNVSSDYQFSTDTINGFSVECYKDKNDMSSDFYYLYCFNNGFSFYKYDSKENTIQRAPEIEIEADETSVSDKGEGKNIIDKFGMLSTNGKIIIICLAIILLGTIALIILLIIRSVKNTRDFEIFDDDFDDDDFDEVSLNGLILDDGQEDTLPEK